MSDDTEYVVTDADIGHSLVLVVTASNTAGSVSAVSAATSVVSDWVDIPGATDSSLFVDSSLIGHELRLKVTAANTVAGVDAFSLPTQVVTEPVVPPPPLRDPSDDVDRIGRRFREHGLI